MLLRSVVPPMQPDVQPPPPPNKYKKGDEDRAQLWTEAPFARRAERDRGTTWSHGYGG